MSDSEIVDGIRYLAQDVGVFGETAGGVTVSAALALAEPAGSVRTMRSCCVTGHGLKTVEALQGAVPEAPIIAPRIRELEALYGRDV